MSAEGAGGQRSPRERLRRRFRLVTGELFWPVMIFTAFVILGIVWGLGTGGDARIAVWDAC